MHSSSVAGPTDVVDDALERGREAYRAKRWREAFEQLSIADTSSELHPDDLYLLGSAGFLIGLAEESVEPMGRAHHGYLAIDRPDRSAACAFRIGFQFMQRGDPAQAGGWFTRGRRVLDGSGSDCVERGYLMFPDAVMMMFGGDPAAAHPIFEEIGRYAARFGDHDLMAISRIGAGQCLIMQGRVPEGVALQDEAVLAVTSGEVSSVVGGFIYCAVIETCREILDVRRAGEWTAALTRWCESQPDLVPYRGQCLVHRAEIMAIRGAWLDALAEAELARQMLSVPPPHPAIGEAYYQLGEINRLRGDFTKAEEAYRKANESGRTPQPGLTAMRLMQGQTEAALATIRRVLDEEQKPPMRARMLAVSVDASLAADDVPGGRKAADELAALASVLQTSYLDALSQRATGAVLLAEGETNAALAVLHSAVSGLHALDAPYEAAQARVLIGLACRRLGDVDSADLDLDAARQTFTRLGAAPALARLEELARPDESPKPAGGLTGREIEVLRLVAAGKTNRGIASDLVLSEKTVARHISNIFTKLGVSTRAAATAYAYEHDLV